MAYYANQVSSSIGGDGVEEMWPRAIRRRGRGRGRLRMPARQPIMPHKSIAIYIILVDTLVVLLNPFTSPPAPQLVAICIAASL